MPAAIASIPHKQRLAAHKIDYLRAMSDSVDYPFQSEDGRGMSPAHQTLTDTCIKLTGLAYWQFTNCCTDSLQIAFSIACDIGDTVIIPAYGWRAIMNAPMFVGLNVVFCDIDETGNVDLDKLEKLIIEHEPSAVLIVHNFGTIVDVRKISSVCSSLGVKIIEDAAPSFPINVTEGYKVGTASDFVCFSFDFTKSPGCLGAGGAIATSKQDIAFAISTVCSHTSTGRLVGTKSYLDTTSAAVLNTDMQLVVANNYRTKRVEIANIYNKVLPYPKLAGINNIYHRFIIIPDAKEKDSVIAAFNEQKILAKPVFKANWPLPLATQFADSAIELPCHHFIDKDDLLARLAKIV